MRECRSVVCEHCNWVHFEVDVAHIKNWQITWNEFWPTLDEQGKEAYGLPNGPPTPEDYFKCFRCGGHYKDMRDAKDGDIKLGSTIQSILRRDEEWPNS